MRSAVWPLSSCAAVPSPSFGNSQKARCLLKTLDPVTALIVVDLPKSVVSRRPTQDRKRHNIVAMNPLRDTTTTERDTLWDRAYAALKADLLAGRLAPGDRVVLRQFADKLGISLTPVRDAVNRLIAEKVLDHGGLGQGGGAVVPLLNADQFNQLMTVRSSLEPAAAAPGRCARRQRRTDCGRRGAYPDEAVGEGRPDGPVPRPTAKSWGRARGPASTRCDPRRRCPGMSLSD